MIYNFNIILLNLCATFWIIIDCKYFHVINFSCNVCLQGGPYYDILHCLLGAYVCYRPDVGYVQGMSFIAAVLILNLEAPDAFVCFANLLNRPCHMAFFCLNQKLVSTF